MGLNALFLGYGRMGAALGEAWLGAGLIGAVLVGVGRGRHEPIVVTHL